MKSRDQTRTRARVSALPEKGFLINPILLLLGDTRQYMVARKKVEYERPGEHGVV